MMKECKGCANFKDLSKYASIKRKNSISYRGFCKECEKQKALARKRAKGLNTPGKETDGAFFKDDPEARMPSDSDLLFWSTDWYDVITEGRPQLRNKVPKT